MDKSKKISLKSLEGMTLDEKAKAVARATADGLNRHFKEKNKKDKIKSKKKH